MGRIIVVGLGPAGADYLTSETVDLLAGSAPVWLRTQRHPAAADLEVAGSFDALYESLGSFDEIYETIVSRLIDMAGQHDEVVYAVPGSPMVAERTVELLRVDDDVLTGRVELDVRPAMAFTDLCWNALGIDPMAEAVTIVDALALSVQGAGRRGPLLVTQVHSSDVLEELIAVLDDLEPSGVTILRALGTPDEQIAEVAWSALRASVTPDHLTSLFVHGLSEPLAASLVRIEELIRERRSSRSADPLPARADVQQILGSAISAIGRASSDLEDQGSDAERDLEEGLADLLFGFVMHVRLASEDGILSLGDVADTARQRHL